MLDIKKIIKLVGVSSVLFLSLNEDVMAREVCTTNADGTRTCTSVNLATGETTTRTIAAAPPPPPDPTPTTTISTLDPNASIKTDILNSPVRSRCCGITDPTTTATADTTATTTAAPATDSSFTSTKVASAQDVNAMYEAAAATSGTTSGSSSSSSSSSVPATGGTPSSVPNASFSIPFPDNPYNATYQAAGCSEAVYREMYNAQKAIYISQAKVYEKSLVEDQVKRAPRAAAQNSLDCLKSVTDQLKQLTSMAEGIYNLILGAGTPDWGKLAGAAMDALGRYACQKIDGYLGQQMKDITSPIVSSVTDLPNDLLRASGLESVTIGDTTVNISSQVNGAINDSISKAAQTNATGSKIDAAASSVNNVLTGASKTVSSTASSAATSTANTVSGTFK